MASLALESLRAALAAMPPGTLVPRDWVLEQLSGGVHASQEAATPAPATPVDLSIRDLAQLFGKQSSTVRAWVERGDFPGAYKLNGKEWRVPLGAVEGFQNLQRQRSRPISKVSAWRKVGHPKATTQP